MRKQLFISLPLLALLLIAPQLTHAASGVLTAIIPSSGACVCDGGAPDFGCVLQVIQTLMNDFVAFGSIIITLFIARAGFQFIANPTSEEARSKARAGITNAVIGLLIVLGAWLIVDSVMKVVYNSGASGTGVSELGPWNQILTGTGGNNCIMPRAKPGTLLQAAGTILDPTGNAAGGNGSPTVNGSSGAMCSPSNGACSVSALQAYGLTTSQANAMSCIAVTESSGVPSKYNSGGSGACGTFQILAGKSTSNWYKPSLHSGSCSVNSSCTDAACNLQTATIMFKQSGYSPWICPGCNAKAHACVAQYDPGHGE